LVCASCAVVRMLLGTAEAHALSVAAELFSTLMLDMAVLVN